MIKMQIIGNLGKDCVVNTVNGKNVINFTVAHTEKYKDSQGNNQEKTTWVDCAYWTDRTAISPYLTKGKQVFVEGNPEVRTLPGRMAQPALLYPFVYVKYNCLVAVVMQVVRQ